MTTPIHNTQIVGQGLARLTSAFTTQPAIRAWLAVCLQPWQDLEDATFAVLTMRFFSTAQLYALPATNVVFDVVGALVGQTRNGMSDSDYKSMIYLRVAVNRATGRVTDWSNFGKILLETAGGPIGFWGDQSGVFFSVSDMELNANLVGQLLALAVPNGQHGVFAYTTWPDTGGDLAFGSVYDATDGEQGFGSVYDATAGGNVGAGVTV